ncbi:serine hydrolase [Nonomuraea sp. NPDC050394]|uniref:serine hydrolase n=1 Tax=Nonomuraea sp. NPDC050394 TaxID=3364363 RepID=UPI0037941B6B
MTSKSLPALAVAATLLAGSGVATEAGAAPSPSPSATGSPGVEIPATPAGQQLRWVLGAIGRVPVPETEIKEHFAGSYLAVLPPAEVNAFLRDLAGLTLNAVDGSRPKQIEVTATLSGHKFMVTLGVDDTGKIDLLGAEPILPAPSEPKTWKELDERLAKAAPRHAYLAAEIKGSRIRPIHAIRRNTDRPIGSMFKLYILGALAKQIRQGKLSWNTQLTITPELKSLPSGELQDRPDGSKVSVLEAATLMIAISDNTGTDMLLHKVGKRAVEKTMRAWGARDKRNFPVLSTRELFTLKGADYPKHSKAYLALGTAAKRAYLRDTVAKVPLASIAPWLKPPRELDTIEWFASPSDIARAHAELRRFKDPNVGRVMSVNPGGLAKGTWYKGGSEVGLLALGHSYRAANGKVYVLTTLAANPAAPFPSSATRELLALAQGAVKLAK